MDRIQEMRLLRDNKVSLRVIGEQFGISRERVRQLIGNTGHFLLFPEYRREELLEVKKYFRISNEELEKMYGVTDGYFKKFNLPYVSKYEKGYKRCSGECKQILPISSFGENQQRCRECSRKYISNMMKTEKYKNKQKKYQQDKYNVGGVWHYKNLARSAVRRAIKNGTLTKGECFYKNKSCKGRIEAHHYLGYEKENQLDIQWICRYHHMEKDKIGLGYIKERAILST